MAILHVAEVSPSKPDMLSAWLPTRRWYSGIAGSVSVAGAYRFDDPDGEVGIETFLIGAPGGRAWQVPVTYRAAPLAGAEPALVRTLEHSVLGRRWVYDGVFDPVYVQAVASAMLTGGTQAELELHTDQGVVRRTPTTFVSGSGRADTPVPTIGELMVETDGDRTTIRSAGLLITVLRTIGGDAPYEGRSAHLSGTWPGRDTPAVLALLTLVDPAEGGQSAS